MSGRESVTWKENKRGLLAALLLMTLIVAVSLSTFLVYGMENNTVCGIRLSAVNITDTLCGSHPDDGIMTLSVTNTMNESVNLTLLFWVNNSRAIVFTPANTSLIINRYEEEYLNVHLKGNESYPSQYDVSYELKAINETNSSCSSNGTLASISVEAMAPVIEESGPAGLINSSNIILRALTDENSECRFSSLDEPFGIMEHTLSGNEKEHTAPLYLSDGGYRFFIRCRDAAGNSDNSSAEASFEIDTKKPSIVSSLSLLDKAEGIVLINATTDEFSECRAGPAKGPFDSLPWRMEGEMLRHSYETTLNEGWHTITVKCRDSAKNTGERTLETEINLGIKADISILRDDGGAVPMEMTGEEVLKEGVYLVKVETNKDVRETPILMYSIDGRNYKQVALAGNGKEWHGFLIVNTPGVEAAAVFSLRAKGTHGEESTTITSGRVFLIDTKKPPEPDAVYINLENRTPVLRWHQEGEYSRFRIYRSGEKYVTYANYYTTTGKSGFRDVNVSPGSYYYRISTVDDAGNEGALSSEVSVNVGADKNGAGKKNGAEKTAQGNEISSVKDEISSTLSLIRESREKIKLLPLSREQGIFAVLGIDKTFSQNIEEMNRISELVNGLSLNQSEDAIKRYLDGINLRIKKVLMTTPRMVSVEDKSEYTELNGREELDKVGGLLIDQALIDASDIPLLAGENLNKSIKKEIMRIRITPLEGEDSYFLIVRVRADLPPRSVVYEYIPKNVAMDSSDISASAMFRSIISDPLVRFESGAYTYGVRGDANISRAKKSVTLLVLNETDKKVAERLNNGINYTGESSKVTGMSVSPAQIKNNRTESYNELLTGGRIFTKTDITLIIAGVAIIVSLLIYYIVFVVDIKRNLKTMVLFNRVEKGAPDAETINKEDEEVLKEAREIVRSSNNKELEGLIKSVKNAGITTDKNIKTGAVENQKEDEEKALIDDSGGDSSLNKIKEKIKELKVLKEEGKKEAGGVYREINEMYKALGAEDKKIVYALLKEALSGVKDKDKNNEDTKKAGDNSGSE